VIAATSLCLNSQVVRNLTISIGVAALAPGRHESDLKALADRLIAEADAALYRAKALGRNRVQLGAWKAARVDHKRAAIWNNRLHVHTARH
jgi:hypothetical protein